MDDKTYVGDYFFVTPEMTEARQRVEAMTNPVFPPGCAAGVACLRGGNFGYGAYSGMTREALDRMWDAEKRAGKHGEGKQP